MLRRTSALKKKIKNAALEQETDNNAPGSLHALDSYTVPDRNGDLAYLGQLASQTGLPRR